MGTCGNGCDTLGYELEVWEMRQRFPALDEEAGAGPVSSCACSAHCVWARALVRYLDDATGGATIRG
jgi:hypothetical protein